MPFSQIHTDGSLEKRRREMQELTDAFYDTHYFPAGAATKYGVKRGLRNADGTGVVAGLTKVSNVHGYVLDEGERSPVEGELTYRGINIKDIVKGCKEADRFGFEEVAWLLLFGKLPTSAQLDRFNDILSEYRELPTGFAEDMIMKAPSNDIMNKIARSVMALYSYDLHAEDNALDNIMRQSIELIARLPTIMVQAYQVKRRAYDNKSYTDKEMDISAEKIVFVLLKIHIVILSLEKRSSLI